MNYATAGPSQEYAPRPKPYPIVPSPDEARKINKLIPKVGENERVARDSWRLIYALITNDTRISPATFKYRSESVVFDLLQEHILRAVLLVAIRFNWPPEEILALWNIEGLPCWSGRSPVPGFCPAANLERKNTATDPISWDHRSQWTIDGFTAQTIANNQQARIIARSIVLWARWGLDVLVPTYSYCDPVDGTCDNLIKPNASVQKHDEKFTKAYETIIKPHAPANPVSSESPLDYLKSDDGPIQVSQTASGRWKYGTKFDYHATILSMQYARFKYLEAEMVNNINQGTYGRMEVRGIPLVLNPPFPALVRTFYNCKKWTSRKTIIRALKQLVDKDLRGSLVKKKKYDSEALRLLYVGSPPPRSIAPYIYPERRVGMCYLGGLRFEALRQVYAVLFANTL
jgi:hypothetical protein